MKSDNDLISASLEIIPLRMFHCTTSARIVPVFNQSISTARFLFPHAKNRKACQGSLQVNSTNESGVRALALPHTWVLLGTCRQREESPASALPYCFSVFCFLGTAFSSVYHRPIVEEGRIEKWNSLMILHSPALLFTADVEDGRLEIGFIVS